MWWSQTSVPNFSRRNRSAIAIPTALPKPWPSGPVVVSTPGVSPYSGWPGVSRAELAELLDLVEADVVAGEVQARVEQHRRVAGREHEAVAVGPRRVGRVVLHHARVEHVGGRRERERRARVAGLRGLHRVDGQRADRVDAELGDVLLRHRRGSRRNALLHLVEREHGVVAGVAGGAELRQAVDAHLLLRLARGLEERARVELGRVRVERFAQRGRDREAAVGVDVHLAHAVADALLDLLDRHAEGGLELAAGGVDPGDELRRNATRSRA